MFDIDQAITLWRRRMAAGGIKSAEVLDELESHLRDDVERHVRAGIDPQGAFDAAVENLGSPGALGKEFARAGRTRQLGRRTLWWLWSAFRASMPPSDAFAPIARQSLEAARAEAARLGHDYVGTEHVLLAVLGQAEGAVGKVLQAHNVDGESVRKEIQRLVTAQAPRSASAALPLTPRARKALYLAGREARTLQQRSINPEHILLGLLRERGGVAGLALRNLGVRLDQLREAIARTYSRT